MILLLAVVDIVCEVWDVIGKANDEVYVVVELVDQDDEVDVDVEVVKNGSEVVDAADDIVVAVDEGEWTDVRGQFSTG